MSKKFFVVCAVAFSLLFANNSWAAVGITDAGSFASVMANDIAIGTDGKVYVLVNDSAINRYASVNATTAEASWPINLAITPGGILQSASIKSLTVDQNSIVYVLAQYSDQTQTGQCIQNDNTGNCVQWDGPLVGGSHTYIYRFDTAGVQTTVSADLYGTDIAGQITSADGISAVVSGVNTYLYVHEKTGQVNVGGLIKFTRTTGNFSYVARYPSTYSYSSGGVAADAANSYIITPFETNSQITISKINTSLSLLQSSSYSINGMGEPVGMALDGSGNVWTTGGSGTSTYIRKFTPSGNSFTLDTELTFADLLQPNGIAISGTNILVSGVNWVRKFSVGLAAPVTTASVSTGTYTSAQNVILTCTPGGSACDKIYYTTNGDTPAVGGPTTSIYSSALDISSTTTLKYFAKDVSGTSETVKTNVYTINIPDTSNPTFNSDPGLSASPASPTQINLSWNDTAVDNVGVVGYKIYISSEDIDDNTLVATIVKPALSYQRTGLLPSTSYSYYIKAYDAAGLLSVSSSIASATTNNPVAPDAPTNVTATAGNAQANVSWSAPVNNGGAIITKYTVTPYIGATAQTPTEVTGNPATTAVLIAGLNNGTAYTFTVTAVNSAGIGASSSAGPAGGVTPIAAVTVTASAVGGTISPSGTLNGKVSGDTFSVSPTVAGQVANIGGTCAGTPAGTTFTLGSNSSACTIVATFSPNSAIFESAPKEFVGKNDPMYGNISWNSVSIGNSAWNASVPAGTVGQLSAPQGMAKDSTGNFYVVNQGNHSVKKYNSSGVFQLQFGTGSAGNANGQLNNPWAVAVDSNGNVYVGEINNTRVQKFNASGVFQYWIGKDSVSGLGGKHTIGTPTSGSSPGMFSNGPYGVAIDSVNNVYVTDRVQGVQKFDSDGNFITKWLDSGYVGGVAIDSKDKVYTYNGYNNNIRKTNPDGTAPSSWNIVGGDNGSPAIAVDTGDNIYIGGTNTVALYSSTGVLLGQWGTSGSAVGNLYIVRGIIVDSTGNMYVSEQNNNRVQKFTPTTSIKMRVRTSGSDTMSGADAWTDACNVTNGGLSTVSSCVNNGDRWVQYQATLSTDTGTNVPQLGAITIETKKTYSTDFLSSYLISSPFNTNFDTGTPYNKLTSISWNANRTDAGSTAGLVGFQVRAAADTTTLQTAQWCGPVSCGNLGAGGDSNFYKSTPTGETISIDTYVGTQTAGEPDKNKYFQYASFLKAGDANDTADKIPVLQDVTVAYSFNTPPFISTPTVTQETDGKIKTAYQIKETKGDIGTVEQTTSYPNLFYRPNGVTIVDAGALANVDTNTVGTIVINKNSQPVPTLGKALVDSELVDFITASVSGENVTLNITTRHQTFSGSYNTLGALHSSSSQIYFLATQVSGTGTGEQMALTENFSTDKYIYWDAKNEPNISLSGTLLSNMSIKVAANDGDGLNPIGYSAATLATLDYESPKISSITASPNNGTKKAGEQITLTLKFTENITTTGTSTVKLSTVPERICTFNGITNTGNEASAGVPCAYTIQPDDLATDLSVSEVSGTIDDSFANRMSNFIPIANIVAGLNVDAVAPTLNDVRIQSNNADMAKAKVGDDITVSFTASEELGANPTVTIVGKAATVSHTGNNYTAIYRMVSGDNEGSVTFSISNFQDVVGNSGIAVSLTNDSSSVTFDKTAPTVASSHIVSSNAISSKAKVGDTLTLTLTSSETLLTNPTVTIATRPANVSVTGALTYQATYVLTEADASGEIPLTIDTIDSTGNNSVQVTGTTDDSKISLDKTAPTIAQVTAVPMITNNVTPSYVFSTDENGVVSYTGGCTGDLSNAVSGNNALVFNALAEGIYNCKLNVTDEVGNRSADLNVSEFTIDTTGLDIDISSPAQAAHIKAVYAVNFNLHEDIQSGQISFAPVGGGSAITKTLGALSAGENSDTVVGLVDGTTYDLSISALDKAGNNMNTATKTGIVYDTTSPVLTLNAPNFFNNYTDDSDISYVIDNNNESLKDASLTFTRTGGENAPDQICNLNKAQDLTPVNHEKVNTESACENPITLVSGAVYTVELSGTDLAGNSANVSVTNKKFDNTPPTIAQISSTNPDSIESDSNTIYSAGAGRNEIVIVAKFSETLKANSTVTVELQNQDHTQVPLANDVDSDELVGTYTVQASAQRLHDTADLTVASVISSQSKDLADNDQVSGNIPAGNNLGDLKNLIVDTGGPILISQSAQSGFFKATANNNKVLVTLTYGEKLKNVGSVDVRINANGSNPLVHLSSISDFSISGEYTVQPGDWAQNLAIKTVENEDVADLLGNPAFTENFVEKEISTTHIDTEDPANESVAVNAGAAEANSQIVNLTLGATDNFPGGAMKIQLSNDGSEWCDVNKTPSQKSDYAVSVANWDILDSNCGGVDPNPINEKENRTIYVKYFDEAENFKVAQDDIMFDGIKPRIALITSTKTNGTYGPGEEIPIKVTYTENIIAGSQVKLIFNNAATITLTKPSGDPSDSIEGIYTVGAFGQDTSELKVAKVDQVVTDTAENVQDQTDVVPTGTNLDANSSLIIDTTAPTTTLLTLDRSETNGKIAVVFKPSDPVMSDQSGMKYQVNVVAKDISCSYDPADSASTVIVNQTQDTEVIVDDIEAGIVKVCVQFIDKVGNKGSQSILSPETPQNFNFSDISNKSIGFYGSFLTWKKPADRAQDVGVGGFQSYQLITCSDDKANDDCVPNPDIEANRHEISGEPGSYNQNYFTHNGLTDTKKYCYRVRFKDANGDLSKFSDTFCSVPGESVSSSAIEVVLTNNQGDISITDITKSSATISLKTVNGSQDGAPLPTMVNVELFTDEALTQSAGIFTDSDSVYNVDHVIHLTGLESNKTYYIRIVATDSTGHASAPLAYGPSVNSNLTFSTLGKLAKISNISDPPTILLDTKVQINFTTDQEANCYIQYGTKPAVNPVTLEFDDSVYEPIWSLETKGEYTRKHSMYLTSLFPKTPYYYRIGCLDNYDEELITTVYSYTIKEDSETKIKTLDTGKEGKFQTLDRQMTEADFAGRVDGTAPVISSISLANVTGDSATITWNTNEKTNSSVAYEMEGATFTKMEADYQINSKIENYSTVHSITLNNLIPATKYRFAPMSMDVSGNIAVSDFSLLTTKEPSSLSSIRVLSKALGQATISWSTGSATNSLVEYGLSTSYGQKKENSSKVKEHEVTISDLTPGETYHFRVKGEDDQKNIFASSDMTFQPKAPPKISDFKISSIFEHGATVTFLTNVSTDALITYTDSSEEKNSGFQGNPIISGKHEIKLKDLASGSTFGVKVKVRDEEGNETEETFTNFTTTKDENPPKIDRVKTDSALTQSDKVQAIISWTTDEVATGKVIYKEGKGGEEKTFDVNSTPAFSHIGVITSFKPGVVYYFKVKSTDQAGNEGTSTDYAVLTPKKSQNIIQIIIGNFTDIFGWAKF